MSTCTLALAMTFIYVASVSRVCVAAQSNMNEQDAVNFLKRYNDECSRLNQKLVTAEWSYSTNLTDYNAKKSEEAQLIMDNFQSEAYQNASIFDATDFSEDTKRQLKKCGRRSSPQDQSRLVSVLSKMGKIYAEAKISIPGSKQLLSLNPHLEDIMFSSTEASERLLVWKTWRENVGRPIRPLYMEYVQLKNQLAKLNGYDDYGHFWRSKYETDTFEDDVMDLYKQLRPLYLQLHSYVRRKLYATYGPSEVDVHGPLPAHLLGDMWGRFWLGLYPIVKPFPNQKPIDPTDQFGKLGYDVIKMFQVAEDFYVSMGLLPLPSTFWTKSMLQRPEGREVMCHATAWDFGDGQDFRIKMCANVTLDDFLTIHHELGHVQYFLQYSHQPFVYRNGANDGFHEAIGELMSMCVSTPQHMQAIGLLPDYERNYEQDINFLLRMALTTISTLPFHLVNDLWRWKVFAGEIPSERWNSEYWKLKEDIVGVKAPITRDASDLDPAAIFHVALDYDMIRYFIRTIVQFQFGQSLCRAAGHTGPLHTCDFYNSTNAGQKLSDMMRLGSSKPWPEALEALTGTKLMAVDPIREYFMPLETWLIKENEANGDIIGWKTDGCFNGSPRSYSNMYLVLLLYLFLEVTATNRWIVF